MSAATIKTLPSPRWKEYRALRLEALRTDPQAFWTSTEEALKNTPKTWRARLTDRVGKMLFAEIDGELVGMIGVFHEKQKKVRHHAVIISVFVQPRHRGKGISKLLFRDMLKHIRKRKSTRKIKLAVTPGQDAALRLYKRFGFKVVGKLKKELRVGKKFHDELIMEKIL